MKKKILIIIVLSFFIMIPSTVKAANVSVSLSCPSTATKGSNIQCKINVTSDVEVNGIAGLFNLSGLTYSSIEAQSDFSVYGGSASGFALGKTGSGKSGTFTVAVVNLNVTDSGTITISGLDLSDTSNNPYTSSNVSSSIRLKSTNNNLGGLSISSGTLSPAFNPATTNYTATVDAASVTINATKGDNYQSISGNGTKTLNYGENKFQIVVTSETGATKTYTIVINRPDTRSTNNYLKSLTVSNGSISFSKSNLSYKVKVDNKVTSITVGAQVEDSKSTFAAGYGPRTVNLNYGKNEIPIKVVAQNGGVRTYTVVVEREDNRSTNNYLKSLTVSNGSISFSKSNLSYKVKVDSKITSITIGAQVEDGKATFAAGYGPRKVNLNYGKNEIPIKVVAENGGVRTYTVVVEREDNRSTNNYLKSISLSEGTIIFDKDTLDYNISVNNNVTKINVVAEAEDKKSNVVIENPDLVVGDNVIKINVTAENNTIKTYTIKVKRLSENEKLSDNNNITSISIFGHDFEFKKDKFKYNINISSKEDKLIFNVLLEDKTATYSIIGNKKLKDGSIVTVTSISASGKKKEYKFIISKEKDKEMNNVITSILISIIYLAVGFVFGHFFENIKRFVLTKFKKQ